MISPVTPRRIRWKKFSTSRNPFDISDNTLGAIVCIGAALLASADSVMLDYAESEGVSTNAMMLYASICTLVGATAVDAYYWYVGYGENQHWFVLFDIWTKTQREKFLEIPGFWQWFAASCGFTYFACILFLASFIYVSDVADTIAIYDAYPIFVPLYGLCFKTGDDWKHRYFLCLLIVIIGVFLTAQPGFIFGYSTHVNAADQLIGVILSLSSAILTAFLTVSWVMLKKLAYLDLMKQQAELMIDIPGSFDAQRGRSSDRIHMPPIDESLQPNKLPAKPDDTTPLIEQTDAAPETTIDSTYTSRKSNSYEYALSLSDMEGFISDRETNFEEIGYLRASTSRRMKYMMNQLDNSHLQIQSTEYIIQNDWALTSLFVEYYSITIISQCLVFSLLSEIKGDETTSSLWQQFTIIYGGTGSKCLWYTIGASILWWLDYYLFTYGAFKVINAPVVAILDVSDVVFTFVLSYIWLGQTPNYFEILGAALIVIAIIIAVYPWEKIINGSKYESIFKNF